MCTIGYVYRYGNFRKVSIGYEKNVFGKGERVIHSKRERFGIFGACMTVRGLVNNVLIGGNLCFKSKGILLRRKDNAKCNETECKREFGEKGGDY